jgi:hypothetical protein
MAQQSSLSLSLLLSPVVLWPEAGWPDERVKNSPKVLPNHLPTFVSKIMH